MGNPLSDVLETSLTSLLTKWKSSATCELQVVVTDAASGRVLPFARVSLDGEPLQQWHGAELEVRSAFVQKMRILPS